jgi:hypothetical protein
MVKNGLDFPEGEHDREVPPMPCPDGAQFVFNVLLKDVPIEKQDCITGLFLAPKTVI